MKTNEHEHWVHRLSEVVDGTLEPDERRAAEAHLDGCATCREILDDLHRVVAEAATLGEVRPTRDLWPGIEASLAPVDRDVLHLPAGGARRTEPRPPAGRRRGLFLSAPQLAAAAAVLVLLSSAATWALAPGGAIPVPGEGAGVPATGAVRAAAAAPGASPELARQVAQLGAALEASRDRLDPETLRMVEKNLAVIERAIEDSRRALAVDPSNDFLQEHLERAYERKLSYLQEAAGIVRWASS